MRSPVALVAAAGALTAVLAASGCTSLGDPAAAQGVARNDLVSELATQLSNSATLTYSATYRLRGGDTASLAQAQDPARTALVHPGGRLITTDESVTRCAPSAKGVTCTITAAPGAAPSGIGPSGARPSGAAPSGGVTARRGTAERALDPGALAADTGMVVPSTVLALLETAALDAEVVTEQHDTTIAGHHATCIDVGQVDGTAVSAFSACVTNEGALGSFTGTLAGTPIDVAMTHYSDRVESDAFAVPPNARTVDRRGA